MKLFWVLVASIGTAAGFFSVGKYFFEGDIIMAFVMIAVTLFNINFLIDALEA